MSRCVGNACSQGRAQCPSPLTCNRGIWTDEPVCTPEDAGMVVYVLMVAIGVLAIVCAVLPVLL